jgi:hypothetical protein
MVLSLMKAMKALQYRTSRMVSSTISPQGAENFTASRQQNDGQMRDRGALRFGMSATTLVGLYTSEFRISKRSKT